MSSGQLRRRHPEQTMEHAVGERPIYYELLNMRHDHYERRQRTSDVDEVVSGWNRHCPPPRSSSHT